MPILVLHPRQEPGQGLPVPADPPMLPLEIGEHPGRKTVGQVHVAEKPTAQIAALNEIMGQQGFRRESALQAGLEGVHVQDALPCIAPLAEYILINIAVEAAVGVQAALTREDAGEFGSLGILQTHADLRLQDPIAPSDAPGGCVDFRTLQRVGHGSGHAHGGTCVQHGIPVQDDEISYRGQAAVVPLCQRKAAFLAAKQGGKRHDGPPLPFPSPPDPVSSTVFPSAKQKTESAPVGIVEMPDPGCGEAEDLVVFGPIPAVPLLQIHQKAEEQVFSRVPVGQAEKLQLLRRFLRLFGPRQQYGADGQGPALGGDAVGIVQTRKPTGMDAAAGEPGKEELHRVVDGRKDQQGCRKPCRLKGQGQRGSQRQQEMDRKIGGIRLSLSFPPQGAAIEEFPHMTAFCLRSLQGLPCCLRFRYAVSGGQLRRFLPIILP